MKVYDNAAWWALCKAAAPWLAPLDFDQRWRATWMLGEALGVVIDTRKV